MSLPIADALYREIDEKAHADFLWFAEREITLFMHRNSDESWQELQRRINAYLPVYAEESNWPLRPIELRLDGNHHLIPWLPPPPPLT